MKKIFARASGILLVIMVITGLYTGLLTLIGKTLLPVKANGSVVKSGQQITGSHLLAQPLSADSDLWGREMKITVGPNQTLVAQPTNLSPASKSYQQHLRQLKQQIAARNPQASRAVPQELYTISGSGWDPAISLNAALWQVPRIAAARHLSQAKVAALIKAQASRAVDKLLGEQTVNVAQVNQQLNQLN